jgi:hypothetical protein
MLSSTGKSNHVRFAPSGASPHQGREKSHPGGAFFFQIWRPTERRIPQLQHRNALLRLHSVAAIFHFRASTAPETPGINGER